VRAHYLESDEYCKEHGDSTDYVHLEHPVYGTQPFAFKRTRDGLTLQAARLFAVDAQCQYVLTPDKDTPVLLFDKTNYQRNEYRPTCAPGKTYAMSAARGAKARAKI
jgi:hypothetical protein